MQLRLYHSCPSLVEKPLSTKPNFQEAAGKKMNDELLTLSKLFNERLFRIPDYQRGYAWGEQQLEDFWSDLNQIAEGRNHNTGVQTLENVPKELSDKWEEY